MDPTTIIKEYEYQYKEKGTWHLYAHPIHLITQRHLRLRGVPNRGWTGIGSRVVTSELLLAIELFLTIEDLASSF